MSFFDRLRRIFGGAPGNGEAPAPMEMISCHDALSLVYEFLDGELEEVSHERVKAHFDVCQRCYPHLKLEGAFRAALQKATGSETAPPELRARIGELLSEAGGR
jgi:mycothiol system anti-sigma-R factor